MKHKEIETRGSAPAGEGRPDFPFYASLVADHCHDAIIVTDVRGRTEWVNAAFRNTTGYGLEEIRGRKPGELLQGPETDAATVQEIRQALASRTPVRVVLLNYTRGGAPYWVELHISPVFDGEGRHTHFIAVERDVTERRALEERARFASAIEEYQQAERRLIVEMAEWLYSAKSQEELFSIVELSMRTLMPEADGAIYIYAAERDTLVRVAQWGDAPLAEHVLSDECWSLRRGRAYHYGGQTIQMPCGHAEAGGNPTFCLPIVAQSETIGLMHLAFTAFPMARSRDAFAHEEFVRRRWMSAQACAEQISLALANVRLRDELEDRSLRDQLTGLWNRRWLLESGARTLRRALATGAPLTLLMADIDHFKAFNDSYGHDAGDRVLREVAGALAGRVQPPAAVARMGGEEFAVVLPGMGPDAGARTAESLRACVEALSLRHHGRDLPPITLSVGLARAPHDGAILSELLGVADRALYAAKEAGRNRVVVGASCAPAPRGETACGKERGLPSEGAAEPAAPPRGARAHRDTATS